MFELDSVSLVLHSANFVLFTRNRSKMSLVLGPLLQFCLKMSDTMFAEISVFIDESGVILHLGWAFWFIK